MEDNALERDAIANEGHDSSEDDLTRDEWSWFPPRPNRQPRPCADDPSMMDIPYCIRWEVDGLNRTVLVGAAGEEKLCVCHDCMKALTGKIPKWGTLGYITLAYVHF